MNGSVYNGNSFALFGGWHRHGRRLCIGNDANEHQQIYRNILCHVKNLLMIEFWGVW
jgi:hypothetical protein